MGAEISHDHLQHKQQPSIHEACDSGTTSITTENMSKAVDRIQTTDCMTKSGHVHKRTRSSILMVSNGITGKYISSRICKIAAKFWQQNIDTLSIADQLEIGVSIFFTMLSTNAEMRHIMQCNLKENRKIERVGLRYLNMMGWLIRHLITDNIKLYDLLKKLGTFHQTMGLKVHHFKPMLAALNETFSYYFGPKYDITVKYAMEEIFSFTAKIMTGQDLKIWGSSSSHINLMHDISFLKNLNECLNSSVGKDYLFRYLTQTWCDEIVIFLQSLLRFKKCMSHQEKFIIARNITKISIQSSAEFSLNLSYETRTNAVNAMNILEEKWTAKKQLEISTDFFAEVEMEIYTLIKGNHWRKFVEEIQTLQSKSFSVN